MSKRLSIAILTCNRTAYLKECIDSILNQTFQDFDIFVFDDASKEPVAEELKKLNDKRIYFIGSEKKIGAEENVNRILQYPFNSEYLTIFHDDDSMHPKMLELQVSFLDGNKEVIFVASGFNRVYDNAIYNFRSLDKNKIKHVIYKNSDREFIKAVMSWLTFPTSSTMYRWQAIRGSRWEFEKFSDFLDVAFLMKISKKGPCAFIDAPLVNYRIHAGQYSKVPKKEYEQGAINILSFLKENFPASFTELPFMEARGRKRTKFSYENKKEQKMLQRYSLNFLLRAYADINRGFSDFLRFIKRCRRENLIKYSDFKYIDIRGFISIISIVFKNKKIISISRWMKDLFRL